MAGYDSTKLRLISQDIGAGVAKLWFYTTAADADATILGAGYFANGAKMGMTVGDLVDVVGTTGPKYKRYQVSAVGATTATVVAPTAIT
jgi:hypothetical protein